MLFQVAGWPYQIEFYNQINMNLNRNTNGVIKSNNLIYSRVPLKRTLTQRNIISKHDYKEEKVQTNENQAIQSKNVNKKNNGK